MRPKVVRMSDVRSAHASRQQVIDLNSVVGWQGHLNEASTVAEVVSIVRDYVALISPEEFAQLPEACRPGKFVDADDVSRYALRLAREQCDGLAQELPLLQKLAAFCASASARAGQLQAPHRDGHAR
jgi:Arc/MetJ-type ribon-helix-helix transcriptional regulator